MSVRGKILAVFASGLFVGFGLFAFWARGVLRQSYAQNVEEMMVDESQLLAALLEPEFRSAGSAPSTEALAQLFERYKARRFSARIFDLPKDTTGLDAYVTDERGIVLYSSENPADVGRDFSRWRDVRLTLAGAYGSRSTRLVPADPRTSVHYVAAAIHDSSGAIAGCVAVVKRRATTAAIIERALSQMAWLGLWVIALTLVMGALLFRWITLPLARLEAYVRSISAGRKAPLPALAGGEIEELGRAFEEMRVAVEGKNEIERMAQALSHELKSPLSGIQGAAELLQEGEMEPARQARFLANIVGESHRAREIVERLLDITALESQARLDRRETVPLDRVVEAARDGLLGLYSPRGITVTVRESARVAVSGDAFLLQQCVRNLLQNAIEFSPDGGEVRVWIERADDEARLLVEDDGPGVPAFAQARMFEKFFSMERPSTGRKGSGLGLSFVKEVMALHSGRVALASPLSERGGTRIWLAFASAQQE
jgi:two-component system, OmpR family, sensor histidine kinase CreC